MTVKELRDRLNNYIEQDTNRPGREVADFPIVIHLNMPSMGQRANTEVVNCGPGIDWDAGRMWLEPKLKLEAKKEDYYTNYKKNGNTDSKSKT